MGHCITARLKLQLMTCLWATMGCVEGIKLGTRVVAHDDNPAGRLHSIFTRFRSQENGVSLDQAWARALEFSENDSNMASLFIAEVAGTVQQCSVHAKALQHVANVGDLLMAHGSWARSAIGFGMNRGAGINPMEVISSSDMALLGMLSGLLHSQSPDKLTWNGSPDGEKLADIHSTLAEITDQLSLDPEVPEATKAYLLQRLYSAIDSILLIELRGPQRLLADVAQVRMGFEVVDTNSEGQREPWHARLRAASENVEVAAKGILSMLSPVLASTVLAVTGDMSLALFILSADPNGHPALETLSNIFKPAQLGSGDVSDGQ